MKTWRVLNVLPGLRIHENVEVQHDRVKNKLDLEKKDAAWILLWKIISFMILIKLCIYLTQSDILHM